MQLNKYISFILVACITIAQNICSMDPFDFNSTKSSFNSERIEAARLLFLKNGTEEPLEEYQELYLKFLKVIESINNLKMTPQQADVEWEKLRQKSPAEVHHLQFLWKIDWFNFNNTLACLANRLRVLKSDKPLNVEERTKLVREIQEQIDTLNAFIKKNNQKKENVRVRIDILKEMGYCNSNLQNNAWFMKKFLAASFLIGIPIICAIAYYGIGKNDSTNKKYQ